MKKFSSAILGATGIIGQRYIEYLEAHPHFEISMLCSSDKHVGKKIREIRRFYPFSETTLNMELEELDIRSLIKKNISIVFSALPIDVAKGIELELATNDIAVFSNAGAYRTHKNIPVMIPEINYDHIKAIEIQRQEFKSKGFIITNPNCTTVGIVMVIKPLLDIAKIKDLYISSYQSISGAGYPGIPAYDIVNNIVPYIPAEEEKIEYECRKILGTVDFKEGIIPKEIEIHANCARVPVHEGHLISMIINFEREVSEDELKNALRNFRSVPYELKLPSAPRECLKVFEEETYPQPRYNIYEGEPERARGMTVSVGRIRVKGKTAKLFSLVNNTIRGGAGNVILCAELAVHDKFIETGV